MKTYYLNRSDLAKNRQAMSDEYYIRAVLHRDPSAPKQGERRIFKMRWNIAIICRYLAMNAGSKISIRDLEEDLGGDICLGYLANQNRGRNTSVIEEIREAVRSHIYVEAYKFAGGDFTQCPIVVTHDHADYIGHNGIKERPIREFSPDSKTVDRHATGRLLTGRKDRNPPMAIYCHNVRYAIEYSGRILNETSDLLTAEERKAVCL